MKKFISMVMAAAMVVSLVPATAFAAGDVVAKAKVVDAIEWTETEAGDEGFNKYIAYDKAPELQLTVTDVDYVTTDPEEATMDVTVSIDGAEWKDADETTAWSLVGLVSVDFDKADKETLDYKTGTRTEVEGGYEMTYAGADMKITVLTDDIEEDEFTFTLTGFLAEDDVVAVDLESVLDKAKEGHTAKVSVESDMVDAADLVYAEILGQVLEIDVKDTVDVAEEETVVLKKVTIEAAVGDLPKADDSKDLKLKLSSGFEFVENWKSNWDVTNGTVTKIDGDEAWIDVTSTTDKVVIENIKIEADTAKEGDVATIKVTATDWDSASVEVATVVGEGLVISVDEDEDVPEMWSGVIVENDVLTDDDDNWALEFKVEESVAAAYSEKDEVEFVLPEGVIVTDVKVTPEAGNGEANWDEDLFAAAYQEGDHKSFVFEKRTIGETETEAYEIDVELQLIAVPGFVGDVTVEMLVDGESAGEVVIATFKTPVVVEAQQNDLKIDYRNTEVGSDIVVKEAEAGLWKSGTWFEFGIDKFGKGDFEDDAVYTTNEDDSDMTVEGKDGKLYFTVDEESDEEAGVVTISNLSLYMERNIPAGAYDLTMDYKEASDFYKTIVFAADCATYDMDAETIAVCSDCKVVPEDNELVAKHDADCDEECFVLDIYDVEDVVKEGFINVVTAGREQDDASFTTKVVVPVGESYIVAGEATVALDVPAYVSEAGYTMLPVRAVATGLGINNNNVLWDQTTKTVTILYGQRIITMVAGQKVVNVNGSVIPASATVEIVDGRAFLPMRDLATALGVTDITWDAATKTATLNGNA